MHQNLYNSDIQNVQGFCTQKGHNGHLTIAHATGKECLCHFLTIHAHIVLHARATNIQLLPLPHILYVHVSHQSIIGSIPGQ